ncbi:hypothetical protein, partial [Staphylococcus aureus]
LNADGNTTPAVAGNLVRTEQPTVSLAAGSQEAVAEGATLQPIVTLYRYDSFGKLTSVVDPERNVDAFYYYSQQDPNGDGVINYPLGDPAAGGYLKEIVRDTTSDPLRDS